jgi:hypothetical protein
VIPQFLGRLPFLERLDRLAADSNADFSEVVLLDSKENAIRSYGQRHDYGAPNPASIGEPLLVDPQADTAELDRMYDRLVRVIADRPQAQIVRTTDGDIAQAYRDFVACLGQ